MGRLHVERQDDHPIHNNLSRKVVPANTGCSRLRKHRADDGKRKCPGDYAKTDLFRDPGTWREIRNRTRHLWPSVLLPYRTPQISLGEQY